MQVQVISLTLALPLIPNKITSVKPQVLPPIFLQQVPSRMNPSVLVTSHLFPNSTVSVQVGQSD